MKIKIEITKKLLLRLALFAAVIGLATIFDIFFESNQERTTEIQSESAANTAESNTMYFVSYTNTVNAKSLAQKNTGRKFQVKSHDKYIQKYHQLRNNQVLKAEVQTQTTPLILSFNYLKFKKYFYTFPDDDPLLS